MSEIFPSRTLQQPISLTGVGLHSGRTTTVRMMPAAAGNSIEFVRVDLPGQPSVRVQQLDPQSPPFRTTIRNGPADVQTIEHILSALSALNVTDIRIEIDGPEVPGMDGSAIEFAEALERAGFVTQNHVAKALVVHKPVSIQDGIATITAQPHPSGAPELKIHYTLHYPGHALAQGTYELTLTPETFLTEIARARTFAIRKDAEAMRAAGLGKGANTQNTVIIDGETVFETTLRFPNEPVRHKILDLIGDLYVLGRPVHGQIVAVCSGHKTNRMLAQKLLESEAAGA